MGQYDYERFDLLLKHLDEYRISVAIGENNYANLPVYIETLKALYGNWKVLMFVKYRRHIARKFKFVDYHYNKYLESQATGKGMINKRMLSCLFSIHELLLWCKQKMGLGIEVKQRMTGKQKIRKAFRQ